MKVIVLGGGGHAKTVIGALIESGSQVLGFLDDNLLITAVLDKPRLGHLTTVESYLETNYLALGLGQVGNTALRRKVVEMYKGRGFVFEVVIAPLSYISKFSRIGEGGVVAAGAIIQPGTLIGDFSIINTGAKVDHDCLIGGHTHIAPGVTISGDVTIGDDCLIGVGSTIMQGISIVDNCIIGAGSVVIKSITEPGTYIGVPAKKIK